MLEHAYAGMISPGAEATGGYLALCHVPPASGAVPAEPPERVIYLLIQDYGRGASSPAFSFLDGSLAGGLKPSGLDAGDGELRGGHTTFEWSQGR